MFMSYSTVSAFESNGKVMRQSLTVCSPFTWYIHPMEFTTTNLFIPHPHFFVFYLCLYLSIRPFLFVLFLCLDPLHQLKCKSELMYTSLLKRELFYHAKSDNPYFLLVFTHVKYSEIHCDILWLPFIFSVSELLVRGVDVGWERAIDVTDSTEGRGGGCRRTEGGGFPTFPPCPFGDRTNSWLGSSAGSMLVY